MTSTSDAEVAAEPSGLAVDPVEVLAEAPFDPGEPSAPTELPTPPTADPVLLAARDVARDALAEITDPKTIGADEGHEVHEDHVLSLFFECRLPGYPGWHWAATLSRIDAASEVNVLEVELLPGPGAVTAPDWVPWSERLAQYREAQSRQAADEASAAEAAAAELSEEDEVDAEEDLLENDFSDFDDEIDGVDLDEDASDEDDESDDLDDGFEDLDDDESDDDESDEDDSDDDESDEDADDESDDDSEEDSEDDDSDLDDESDGDDSDDD